MTEKGMHVIEQICADEARREKLTSLETNEEVLKFAKECGYELTAEDLSTEVSDKTKLDREELETVAGGGVCVCVIGGGGRATKEGQNVCACVAAGAGTTTLWCSDTGNGVAQAFRCICTGGGGGKDKSAEDYWREDHG